MKNYMKTLLTLAILLSMIICGYGCNKENPSVPSANVSASPANPEKAKEQLQNIENKNGFDKKDAIPSGKTLRGGTGELKDNQIVFHFEEIPLPDSDPDKKRTTGLEEYGIPFDSIQQMFAEFTSPQPSNLVQQRLKRFAVTAGVKTYKVFDLDHLYEPILPVTAKLDDRVYWEGTNNLNWMFFDDIANGTVFFCVGSYQGLLKRDYIDPERYYTHTVLEEKTVSDRNATETYWVTQKGYYGRNCRYSIELPEKTIFVVEQYLGEQAGQTDNLPMEYMELFITDHGVSFHVLAYPTERPSLEWIASFGAKKFTDFGDLPETVTVPVTETAKP